MKQVRHFFLEYPLGRGRLVQTPCRRKTDLRHTFVLLTQKRYVSDNRWLKKKFKQTHTRTEVSIIRTDILYIGFIFLAITDIKCKYCDCT